MAVGYSVVDLSKKCLSPKAYAKMIRILCIIQLCVELAKSANTCDGNLEVWGRFAQELIMFVSMKDFSQEKHSMINFKRNITHLYCRKVIFYDFYNIVNTVRKAFDE